MTKVCKASRVKYSLIVPLSRLDISRTSFLGSFLDFMVGIPEIPVPFTDCLDMFS